MLLQQGARLMGRVLSLGAIVILGGPIPSDAAEIQQAAEAAESENYWEVLLEQGPGWELVSASGYAVDDGGEYFSQNLYRIRSSTGAYNAPLPTGIQENVAIEAYTEDTTFVLDQRIVREIEYSEQTGQLSPYLQAIAEPEDYEEGLYSSSQSMASPESMAGLFGRCKNREVVKSKTIALNSPINLHTGNLDPGFSGSLDVSGNIQGTATGEFRLYLKRYAIFGFCIPYGLKFDRARAHGNMLVSHGATLSGTINFQNPPDWDWDEEIANLPLFSYTFRIGGLIPVHLGFNLPITVGLELQASVTGSVTFNTGQSAQGAFDYTCFLGDGCHGWSSFVQGASPSTQVLTGSVSGHIRPSVYVEAALRAYLGKDKKAYAQVGIRPYLHGDLWGYYGNNCGDADGDGFFETVDALTFDLDWQLLITGEAGALGSKPEKWTLWTFPRKHIDFWDLIGSMAIEPMLVGASSVPVNTSQRYDVKMRPCWPYGESVAYRLAWDDGTSTSLNGAPQSFVSTYRTWSTHGTKPIQLTALSDGHGRGLGHTTSRSIQVPGTGTQPTGTAPKASFTWTPTCGETSVSFDASGSYDPDGSIVSYEWQYDIYAYSPPVTNTHPWGWYLYNRGYGPYGVTLCVTDNDGLVGCVQDDYVTAYSYCP